MSKVYVVRELTFMYDDEAFYTGLPAGIHGTYSSEDEARSVRQKLEISRLREFPFSDYQEVFRADQETILKLKKFLDPFTEESLFEYDEKYDKFRVKRWLHLPQYLADEQIITLIEMLGIRYYQINVFEEDGVDSAYYVLWVPRLNHPIQIESDQTYKDGGIEVSPYFFASEEEALQAFHRFSWRLRHVLSQENIEELSDQPDLLRSYIDGKSSFKVNDNTLELAFHADSEEIIGLNALLKIPLFELRAIPLAEAEQIPSNPFNEP